MSVPIIEEVVSDDDDKENDVNVDGGLEVIKIKLCAAILINKIMKCLKFWNNHYKFLRQCHKI